MATIFNRDWKSDEKQLFLGQELGIADYVNVMYPELERLALLQRSQFWVETEVSLENDKKQWPGLPEHIQRKTKLNLAWQTMADSFITRAPENAIMKLVSRPELEGMLIQWSYFENIHSRAYSNIIRNVLPNPAEFIDSVKENEEAFARIAVPIEILDELSVAGDQYLAKVDAGIEVSQEEFEDLQVMIMTAYFAIYALEAMMFYASFACTFVLAENDILSGIARNLQLIAKDEALHTQMAQEILRIQETLLRPELVKRAKDKAPDILRKVLATEIGWGHYIFPPNDPGLLGLNAEALEEYLLFIGRNAFMAINIPWPEDLPVVSKNPIPWINQWIDTSNQQVAPQETQVSNYRVGQTAQASKDDIASLGDEFDWED